VTVREYLDRRMQQPQLVEDPALADVDGLDSQQIGLDTRSA